MNTQPFHYDTTENQLWLLERLIAMRNIRIEHAGPEGDPYMFGLAAKGEHAMFLEAVDAGAGAEAAAIRNYPGIQ